MIIEELVTVFGFENRGKGELNRFNRQIDKGRKGLTLFQSALSGFAGGIAASAIAGITRAVTNLVRTLPDAIKDLDSLAKTADKVGVSVENLQRLRFAADLSGVATNTLDMAMQRFSRRVGEAAQGSGELKDTLKQYGIAVKDSEGRTRSNTDVLADLADVIANTEGQQERLRIAFKAFDSEGAALVNMLKNGAAGLKEMMAEADALGIVFGEDAARAAERFTDNLTRLSALTKALKTRIAIDLMPTMEAWVKASIEWYKVNQDIIRQNMVRVVNGIAGALRAVASAGGLAVKAVFRIKDALDDVGGEGAGATVLGGGMIAMAAKRFPFVAALAGLLLVLDDFATYIKGEGKSIIGEAMKEIEKASAPGGKLEHTTAALGDVTEAWANLKEAVGLDREWSVVTAITDALEQTDLWKNSLREVETILQAIEASIKFLRGIGDGPFGEPGPVAPAPGERLEPGDALRRRQQRDQGGSGSDDVDGSRGADDLANGSNYRGLSGRLWDAIPDVLKPQGMRSGEPGAPGSGSGGGSGASINQGALPAGQKDRANRMMNRLIAKGWTPEAAASVVGQAAHESSFNPTALGDNGTAFGLFQWRLDRRRALERFASERGKPASDFDTQVDFFDHERKQRSQAERGWHEVTDVDLGNRIGKQFERYAGGLQHGRATSGRKALAEWQHRGGMAQIGQPTAGPAFEMFGRGTGGLAAVSNTVSEGDRVGGNVTLNAPVTLNNVKGDVAPKKVEAAINSAMERVRAAQRSTDIANQYPVPDGPVIREAAQ